VVIFESLACLLGGEVEALPCPELDVLEAAAEEAARLYGVYVKYMP
jgi:hypothetical protein